MTEALRFRTILVPMDFSDLARRALQVARDMGTRAGPAHLILAHAVFFPAEVEAFAPAPLIAQAESQSAKELERLLIELQDAGISSEYFSQRGKPESVILDLARNKQADLIVMGTHGHSGLAHITLGSVAERVVREAPCPVMTVKEPKA
ncbi:MAG: universal stress protein [Myxococcota bacterium]